MTISELLLLTGCLLAESRFSGWSSWCEPYGRAGSSGQAKGICPSRSHKLTCCGQMMAWLLTELRQACPTCQHPRLSCLGTRSLTTRPRSTCSLRSVHCGSICLSLLCRLPVRVSLLNKCLNIHLHPAPMPNPPTPPHPLSSPSLCQNLPPVFENLVSHFCTVARVVHLVISRCIQYITSCCWYPNHIGTNNSLVHLQEERNAQELLDEEDKPEFTAQAFDSLRQVPMYSSFIKERFERCLDLYLCPRSKKKRINVDPQSLVPKLPKPQDLQPFPTTLLLRYTGHTARVSNCLAHTSWSTQQLVLFSQASAYVYSISTLHVFACIMQLLAKTMMIW